MAIRGSDYRFWTALSTLLAIFLAVGETALAQSAPPPASPIPLPSAYRRAGRLRVATDATYAPFEYVEDGVLQGFDIDLGNALGKELGVRIEWIPMKWAGVRVAPQGRRADLILSGMTVKEDRKSTYSFTRPYFLSGQVIARRRGQTDVATLADLRRSGRLVAVQSETTGEEAALNGGVPDDRIKRFPGLPEALLAVRNGKADAAIGDRPALRTLIAKNYPEMEIAPGDDLVRENVGIAARTGDLGLIHALNEALDHLLVNGTYAQIYTRWIGRSPRAALIAGLEKVKSAGSEAITTDGIDEETTAGAAAGGGPSATPDEKPASGSALTIRPGVLAKVMPVLLQGALVTLELTALSLLAGIPLGLLIALVRLSGWKPAQLAASSYVEVVRGTPLLMQIFVIYYVLGTPEVGLGLPEFWAGVAALSLNAGAYIAEIFRAGIQSVDTGQMEAARSLGMTRGKAMRFVILPQTLGMVLPPLTNEAVALLKDSSLVSVIAVAELMQRGSLEVASSGSIVTVYLAIALVYLAMTLPLTALVRGLELRWRPGGRRRNTAKEAAP